MHPSIIDPVYLIEEQYLIQNENNSNLPFDPSIHSIRLWEKSIIVKAFSTNKTLTFILDIPLVAEQPYLLHLYSIPNNNNTIFIPKNHLPVLEITSLPTPTSHAWKSQKTKSFANTWEWQTLLHSNDCIAQLIQHQEPHNCIYAPTTYENNIVQQIKDNSWMVILKQEVVIKTVCNNDMQYQRSKGFFLVTANNNCNVHILDKILRTHQRYINIRPTIPPPRAHRSKQISPIRIKLDYVKHK